MSSDDKVAGCELCGRAESHLTKHHLIPRTRHKNKRVQKHLSREEMVSRILWLCRPCHSFIHSVLSEKDMALQYNTREALLEQQEIRGFVDWLRTKPAGFKPKSGGRKY